MTWWTVEMDAELKILLLNGLSMGKAASKMHLTRNAIIGRVHRRKDLQAAIQPSARRKVVAAISTPRRPAAAVPMAPRPAPARLPPSMPPPRPLPIKEPITAGMPMIAIRANQCRFPVAEDRSVCGHFLLCGMPVAYANATYCPYHTQLCINGTLAEARRG